MAAGWKKILLEGDAALLDATAPVDVTFTAAAAGSATTASRVDHKHDIGEGVVGDVVAITGAAAALGTSNNASHVDHRHALGPLTADLDFGKNNATGMALDVQATDPATPVEGQIYQKSGDHHPYVYAAA